MVRRKAAGVATVADLEQVAGKFARLYAGHAQLERGSGAAMAPWLREDAQAIAGAIGLYVHGRDVRRFPAALLRLRCWPESLALVELERVRRTTQGILLRRYAAAMPAMPLRFQGSLGERLIAGSLSAYLLREFAAPPSCWKCHGRGDVVRGDMLERCEVCNGGGEAPTGFRARAADLDLSAYQWRRYGQPVYERTLHGLRYLADVAGRGVLEALG